MLGVALSGTTGLNPEIAEMEERSESESMAGALGWDVLFDIDCGPGACPWAASVVRP